VAPKTWVNVDSAVGARLAKWPALLRLANRLGWIESSDWSPDIQIQDLTKPLKFKDNALDAVYMSHTLEHFYLEDGRALLRECFRCLKPGQPVRVLVPNLEPVVQDYLRGHLRATDLLTTLWATYPRHQSRLKQLLSKFFTFPHLTMFDPETLGHELKTAGFSEVSQKAFLESRIPRLDEVELEDRLGGAIIFEGVKPQS